MMGRYVHLVLMVVEKKVGKLKKLNVKSGGGEECDRRMVPRWAKKKIKKVNDMKILREVNTEVKVESDHIIMIKK